MREHFPVGSRSNVARGHRMGHPECSASARIKKLASKLQWARRARRQAEEKLKAMTIGKNKSKGNSITPEFLAKAALSWPSTCARSFADSWRDLVGVGLAGCGRTNITRTREVVGEVLQEMRARECKRAICAVASAPGSAASAPVAAASAPASAASAPASRLAASSPGLMCITIFAHPRRSLFAIAIFCRH